MSDDTQTPEVTADLRERMVAELEHHSTLLWEATKSLEKLDDLWRRCLKANLLTYDEAAAVSDYLIERDKSPLRNIRLANDPDEWLRAFNGPDSEG